MVIREAKNGCAGAYMCSRNAMLQLQQVIREERISKNVGLVLCYSTWSERNVLMARARSQSRTL